MSRGLFLLTGLQRCTDLGLLLLRVLTGIFLLYGVLDNILSAERMNEFVEFLAANGFAAPALMAPLSVYLQFFCGLAFVLGLLTRWAGIILAINFFIAVVMVHWSEDFRSWWPAMVLVGIGLQFALTGAGRYSADAYIERNSKG